MIFRKHFCTDHVVIYKGSVDTKPEVSFLTMIEFHETVKTKSMIDNTFQNIRANELHYRERAIFN